MKRDNKIRELFEDIQIPEELMPDNIAAMLKSKAQSEVSDRKNIKIHSLEKKTNVKTRNITHSKNQRNIPVYTRIIASVAACCMLVIGITVYANHDSGTVSVIKPDSAETEKAVTASSYTDIYNNFKKVYVSDNNGQEIEKIISESYDSGVYSIKPDVYMLNKEMNAGSVIEVEHNDENIQNSQDAKEDVLRVQGNMIYYVSGKTLYFIDISETQPKVVFELNRENIIPRSIYIENNKIVLISDKTEEINSEDEDVSYNQSVTDNTTESSSEDTTSETSETTEQTETAPSYVQSITEGTQGETTQAVTTSVTTETGSVVKDIIKEKIKVTNTLIEIIDITDPLNSTLLNSISQDGKYISSRMSGGYLYIASDYIDNGYSTIQDETDIEKYVPSYSINSEKKYIEPENIIFPDKINNTNYIVVTGLDISAVSPVKSVRALLGYKENVYITDKYIYTFASVYAEKGQETTILRMDVQNGQIEDCITTKVSGVIKDVSSLSEYNGFLRVALTNYNKEKDKFTNSLVILNDGLKQCGSISDFGGNYIFSSVKFDNGSAYFTCGDDQRTKLTIDCTEPTRPMLYDNEDIRGTFSQIIHIKDSQYIAFGTNIDESGQIDGLKIAVYTKNDKGSYTESKSIVFEEGNANAQSPALYKTESLFIDKTEGVIGIPVSFNDGIDIANRYYLFKYSDSEITQIGSFIETHDVSQMYSFTRALCINSNIYTISEGRIVGADYKSMLPPFNNLNLVEPSKSTSCK